MTQQLQEFTSIYGDIGKWQRMKFRPQAKFTSHFGITQRWRNVNGEVMWGYPRWHDGVDRSKRHTISWYDQYSMYAPITAERSGYISETAASGNVYGGQILLYSKYDFRIRICHVFDNEVDIIKNLQAGYAIPKNTYLSVVGNSGMSTGRHSHVEIESWGFHGEHAESSDLLEEILCEQFEDANDPSSEDEIIALYREGSNLDSDEMQTSNWSDAEILKDYKDLLKQGNIVFANKYKMQKIGQRTKKISTLYSSEYVFGF